MMELVLNADLASNCGGGEQRDVSWASFFLAGRDEAADGAVAAVP